MSCPDIPDRAASLAEGRPGTSMLCTMVSSYEVLIAGSRRCIDQRRIPRPGWRLADDLPSTHGCVAIGYKVSSYANSVRSRGICLLLLVSARW